MKTLSTETILQIKSKNQAARRVLLALIFSSLGFGGCAPAFRASPISPTPQTIVETQTVITRPATVAPTMVTPESAEQFDGKHAYAEYLAAQMNFGARPAGSSALRQTGDYIIEQLKQNGWQVETQEFEYRGAPIRNVIGKYGAGENKPLVILGAHYDTRPRADQDKSNPNAPVPGANDGASGVAVLLELARTLDKQKLKNEIWLAFFDAEDVGGLSACDLRVVKQQKPTALCDTNEWSWSVGAQRVAENLPTTPQAVIVVDMIGDADQNIYYERNSDAQLQETLWQIADKLGYRQWFIPEFKWSMSDDHTPFLQKGIRAVDLIDFDYLSWHTTQDTADKVSAASLERVGRVLETWLESKEVIR